LEDLEEISDSSFAQDDQNSFRTLQEGWRTEIEQIFDELREKEKVTSFYSFFFQLIASFVSGNDGFSKKKMFLSCQFFLIICSFFN